MSSHGVVWQQKCQLKFFFRIRKFNLFYSVLGEQSNIEGAASAKVRRLVETYDRTTDPKQFRDSRRTWIQRWGKHKRSSPKPRRKADMLQQWPLIEAKCTKERDAGTKHNACLKLSRRILLVKNKEQRRNQHSFPGLRSLCRGLE